MFRRYGFIGLALVLFAFIVSIFNLKNLLIFSEIITPTIFFTTGFWLFSDALDYYLNRSSILHRIMRKKKIFLYLVFTGVFIGLTFDFFGILVSQLWGWYYVGDSLLVSIFKYSRGLFFGYGIPILMYYSFYRVILYFVKKEHPKRLGVKIVKRAKIKKMYNYLLFIGIIFIVAPLALIPFKEMDRFLAFVSFSLVLLGMWFVLEYVQHERKERTLLEDILSGYWRPLIGLAIAAVITGIIWEGLNVLAEGWTYQNLILQNVTIFGVPIQVILGWIPLYVVYLSFYRAIIKGNDKIWRT